MYLESLHGHLVHAAGDLRLEKAVDGIHDQQKKKLKLKLNYTEGKAKVVTAVSGTYLNAALAI